MRESIPRQVDKKSGVPEEDRGVWNSQGGGKGKCLHSLLRILKNFLQGVLNTLLFTNIAQTQVYKNGGVSQYDAA